MNPYILEGRKEQKTAFFYFDLNLQKIEEAHQSNPWTADDDDATVFSNPP